MNCDNCGQQALESVETVDGRRILVQYYCDDCGWWINV